MDAMILRALKLLVFLCQLSRRLKPTSTISRKGVAVSVMVGVVVEVTVALEVAVDVPDCVGEMVSVGA